MKITKRTALDMLEKIGPREHIDEAARTLPDPIDADRDASLLAQYGIELNQLRERFGASP